MRRLARRWGLWMGLCGVWPGVAGGLAAQNLISPRQEIDAKAQNFLIAGTVVNAVTGAPLARVEVTIADTRSRTKRTSTVTGEGGHFEFAQLPPGKYSLQGSKRGYITSSYEQHEQYSTAIVTGTQFASDKLILRLMPMAMIAGHVLDESGEPVRSARVQLFMEDHSEGIGRVTPAGGASSDDRGYFDIGVLRPGTYFVAVNATPWYAVHPATGRTESDAGQRVSPSLDVAYPTTFYGGATESDAAAPIELKGGERQEIDIRLAPVPALHLVVRAPAAEQGTPNTFGIPVFQKRMFDVMVFESVGSMRPLSAGVMEITGLPAGKYDVTIQGANPPEAQRVGEIDLEHDGQDLNAANRTSLGSLKVKIKLPEEEPLPRQYAVGLRDAAQKIVAYQQGGAGQTVTFDALKPGRYSMIFAAPGGRYAVARTISGAGELAGADVNVTSAVGQEVTAELVEGVVRIEGSAEKNGKPLAGVMVALVPGEPERNVDLFRRDQSDFDGTFTLLGVVPGTYTIVAVEDAWGVDWMKSGVLARYLQHGQSVVVGQKMRGVLRLPESVVVQGK